MANQWLRLWHDMPNDPKWRTVSRISKQPIAVVMATYVHLLVIASTAEERGSIQVIEEDLASALDITPEAVRAILSAMQGRLLKDNKLIGWQKRQPLREDGSAERAKAWRESKKRQSAKQTNIGELQDKEQEIDKEKDTEINTLSSRNLENQTELVFTMFENWQPDASFAEYLAKLGVTNDQQQIPTEVLQEFVCFWCTKTNTKKTQRQWHHALAKSYQYALNREKFYAKGKRHTHKAIGSINTTATDISWLAD